MILHAVDDESEHITHLRPQIYGISKWGQYYSKITLTLRMLDYYMLKYQLKCALLFQQMHILWKFLKRVLIKPCVIFSTCS